uniref:Uncharacterized protein n=1 Tax=Panagrolaimus superbus TaxID=310955 RepID=A0A914XVI9_9BILA
MEQIIIKSPVAVEWRVPENCLKALKPGEYLYSKTFDACNIPGIKYFIEICPNENIEDRHGQTWIYLHIENEDELKIDAKCSIFVDFQKELCL